MQKFENVNSKLGCHIPAIGSHKNSRKFPKYTIVLELWSNQDPEVIPLSGSNAVSDFKGKYFFN